MCALAFVHKSGRKIPTCCRKVYIGRSIAGDDWHSCKRRHEVAIATWWGKSCAVLPLDAEKINLVHRSCSWLFAIWVGLPTCACRLDSMDIERERGKMILWDEHFSVIDLFKSNGKKYGNGRRQFWIVTSVNIQIWIWRVEPSTTLEVSLSNWTLPEWQSTKVAKTMFSTSLLLSKKNTWKLKIQIANWSKYIHSCSRTSGAFFLQNKNECTNRLDWFILHGFRAHVIKKILGQNPRLLISSIHEFQADDWDTVSLLDVFNQSRQFLCSVIHPRPLKSFKMAQSHMVPIVSWIISTSFMSAYKTFRCGDCMLADLRTLLDMWISPTR